MLHQIKAPQFYTDKGLLNPPVIGKIQGFFKTFEYFPVLFKADLNFQGLFMKAL